MDTPCTHQSLGPKFSSVWLNAPRFLVGVGGGWDSFSVFPALTTLPFKNNDKKNQTFSSNILLFHMSLMQNQWLKLHLKKTKYGIYTTTDILIDQTHSHMLIPSQTPQHKHNIYNIRWLVKPHITTQGYRKKKHTVTYTRSLHTGRKFRSTIHQGKPIVYNAVRTVCRYPGQTSE